MNRLRSIVFSSTLLLACSTPPTVNPTRNLQYPVDLTMVCLGLLDPATSQLSGRPMSVCHPRDKDDPKTMDVGRRQLGTFAFIINSGTSELAVADMDSGRLLDLGPKTPGYGMLPLDSNPLAVASSEDGCWVVTANRLSCSLSLIDPSRLLADAFVANGAPAPPATGIGKASHELVVSTQSGRGLSAAIGEIAFLPPGKSSESCQAEDRPLVVATFPACDLVATLSLSFSEGLATVVNAYYVRPDLPGGFLSAGGEPVCPSECAAPSDGGLASAWGMDSVVDAGVDGGTAAPATGTSVAASSYFLQPLALVPGGTRVYVASLRDSAITSFDLGPAGLANPHRFDLAESPVGVNRLRLGVDPYLTKEVGEGVPDVQGQFLRDRGAFLYAFARDDSIRVVDIGGAAPVECDANVIPPPDQKTLPCFPVGSPGRRPLARGPGIRIPSFLNPDSPPPLPRDIAFAELLPADGNVNYSALSGQYGFVLASNGGVYVLNIAPKGEDGAKTIPAESCAPEGTKFLPATVTHSFRESRSPGQCVRTPLSLSIVPQHANVVSDVAFPSVPDLADSEGPHIPAFRLDSDDPSQPDRWLDFPDPDGIVSRGWTIAWEGVLPRTARESGIPRASTDGQSAGTLFDMGARFCTNSVAVGDVVTFTGCTQNSDCQPDDQFSCQVTASGARGMCLPIDTAKSASLLGLKTCDKFYRSRMRYEVREVKETSLVLGLKLDEVPKTTLNPCRVHADCRPDSDHGLGSAEAPDGGIGRAFECEAGRCVQKTCDGDSSCRAGMVCENVPGAGRRCVEAPPVDPTCLPQPMSTYNVRAGKSFLVYGTSLPIVRSQVAAADGSCQPIAGIHPSLVSRIPLSAPKCSDAFLQSAMQGPDLLTKPAFVQTLSAAQGMNPCLYMGSYRDSNNSTLQTDAGASESGNHIRAFFQNPQIRFVLSNLEQYIGDLYGIQFEVQNGFSPLTVQIPPSEVLTTLGTRILTGPTKTPESPRLSPPVGSYSYPYLYVVDQGRTALTSGSHGQVLRINPRSGANEVASFDTAISGSTPFQLQ